MLEPRPHLIGGRPRASTSTEALDVVDPALGEVIGRIPAGTSDDVAGAVSAARVAQPHWARTSSAERGGALRAAAGTLRDHLQELAKWQTLENGKPLADSQAGVLAGIRTIEQYAELGPLHRGRSLQGGWEASDFMVAEPRGVVAALVPWNDPLAIACQMLGAALVTGNTVVLKPSEKTPLSTLRLAELVNLPEGVLNVVLGDGRVGWALVEDPGVDLVLHTGSVPTGRVIAEACGRRLRKAVLELGGNDALIVDQGVDPVWAAGQAATGAFANAGQLCTSVKRIYVHQALAEPFVDELALRAAALRVGNGMDPKAEMGPLIDEGLRQLVHRRVLEAIDQGATCRTGGSVPSGPGFFYPPTVLTEVTDQMAVVREETLGPVAPVRVVANFDEALEAANSTEFGLAATVLTPSQERAQQAWRGLQVRTVKINAVFGGAPGGAAHPRKASGLGYGYGPELLDELTVTKVVHYQPTSPS